MNLSGLRVDSFQCRNHPEREGVGICVACRRVFCRAGDSRPLTSDVRVLAATNRDLLGCVARHQFREDLYYRLAVITLKLPPLRDRRGDVPLIARRLLDRINRDFGRQEPGFRPRRLSDAAVEFIRKHPWPGNVRQLGNALTQAAVMAALVVDPTVVKTGPVVFALLVVSFLILDVVRIDLFERGNISPASVPRRGRGWSRWCAAARWGRSR